MMGQSGQYFTVDYNKPSMKYRVNIHIAAEL